MKVIALLNAKAGTLASAAIAEQAERVRETFFAHNVEADVRPTEGHELAGGARRALAEKPDAVVAGGGDGTLSAVAGVLAGSGTAMGILPLGTLNHFAKDLSIPFDLDKAVETIAAGHVRCVDLAEVNGHAFVNNSSIGIYPQVVRDRDSQRQRLGRGKWLAMFFAMVNALRRYPTVRVRLGVEGRTVLRTTPFVFIGNNAYEMNLFSVKGRHCLDCGQLSLYVANRPGRFGMLRLALRTAFGTLDQDKDFESALLQEVFIDSNKRHLHVAMDGEVTKLAPPLHYRNRPGALMVLVPPPPPPPA